MAAAVWVVGVFPFIMWNCPSWYCTMSATACVSAAEPDRQHQMVSWTRVSLSVTRLAIYAPVVVRESAPDGRWRGQHCPRTYVGATCGDGRVGNNVPSITPSLKVTAILLRAC